MYHDIVAAGAEDASGFPGRDAALYKVTPELFAAHLDAIRHSLPIRLDRPDRPDRPDIPAPPDLPAPPAPLALPALPGPSDPVFTFDDGGVSAMAAADMLEAHGFVGQFFVTTNYIGTRGFLTERHIRDLARRGHVVGSHSCSHPLRMGHCAWPQLLDEWTRSRATLGNILGIGVRVASVPGGDFTPQVAEAAARAGITTLFTSEPTDESRHAFGLTLAGRFTIQKWTTAETAAALAGGEWLSCARQAIVWNAKKLSKRVGGEHYLQLRRILLRHGNEVRWGDQNG
jgi:peptidoglycan/xylan/chitin deacetylase (PgdA/CDA1 family)